MEELFFQAPKLECLVKWEACMKDYLQLTGLLKKKHLLTEDKRVAFTPQSELWSPSGKFDAEQCRNHHVAFWLFWIMLSPFQANDHSFTETKPLNIHDLSLRERSIFFIFEKFLCGQGAGSSSAKEPQLLGTVVWTYWIFSSMEQTVHDTKSLFHLNASATWKTNGKAVSESTENSLLPSRPITGWNSSGWLCWY